MARRTVAAEVREKSSRPDRGSAATEGGDEDQPLAGDRNMLPVVITIAILIVMAAVIAIDAQSVPALSVLAIISLGAVIAAIAMYG